MKAYEAAKRLGMKPADFAHEYGLASHLCKIPDDLEAELFGCEKKIKKQAQTQTVDSAETVRVIYPGCIRFC